MTKEMKHILAENLRELMQKSYNLDTQMKVREASKVLDPKTGDVITPGLTQSTIQRALSAEVNIGLDTLQRLAEVFGVSPITLITPKDSDSEGTVPDASEFAWMLMDKFETLPQDPTLRAEAFSACVIALGIVEQQHAKQKPAPNLAAKSRKARG